MGLNIYMSINNGEEVMKLPVIPPKIKITSSQGTETFETAGYGLVRIIGCRDLQGISWESIFPVHDYPFRRDNSMQGQEYADKLNSWRGRKLPIRLVITSSGFANLDVNIACAISVLDGEVGSNSDFDYSIQLDEVDLLNYTLNNEEELTVEKYNEIMSRLTAIEERLNSVEDAKIYNWMDDNMPEWAKPTIQKLMDRGYIHGIGENELGLTMDIIRALVILDNAGAIK